MRCMIASRRRGKDPSRLVMLPVTFVVGLVYI